VERLITVLDSKATSSVGERRLAGALALCPIGSKAKFAGLSGFGAKRPFGQNRMSQKGQSHRFDYALNTSGLPQ
jgi:hypothetical protein